MPFPRPAPRRTERSADGPTVSGGASALAVAPAGAGQFGASVQAIIAAMQVAVRPSSKMPCQQQVLQPPMQSV